MKTVKEAIERVLENTGVSKYSLAKTLRVQPIMIDNWLTQHTKTMRKDCADILEDYFGEKIDDLFINHRGSYQKRIKLEDSNGEE